ncbi:MAG TPA: nucleoside hydrolase [Actinomycetota bacterium]|nr:nucleoside hydrolase [Actinomycetota bacterium]
MQPLILDVDTGVDDLMALLYAVASPEVDMIGATCVTGNVHVDSVTRNTLVTLELAGAGDVEVARGAEKPLVQTWDPFPVVHGPEGLGAHVPAAPRGSISARDGATLIAQEARRRPGEVLLVSTGPLTNVALALALEPELPNLLAGYALMGGAFVSGGNTTPRSEANIWMDPEAAARVFAAWSGVDALPACIGLDVTEQVWLSRSDLDAIAAPAPDSKLARLIREAMTFYIDFYASTERTEGAAMHDPLAVAAAIDPSLCTWLDTRVEIELDGRWTRGETVTDVRAIRTSPWSDWVRAENARVATEVDAGRALWLLIERLRDLVAARAGA